ncbi:MAG: PRD domain-containing protein [Coriobacteriaceae bacterium]|nr:PRD domain-containing protein [Coriobacteriaceae bacterium]
MDELNLRIDVLQQSGFVDEIGREDLEKLVKVLTQDYGFPHSDELLGVLVTHVAAALKRQRDGEVINPIDGNILEDVISSKVYPEAEEIKSRIVASMTSQLSRDEENFILVHVGGMLMNPDAIKARKGDVQ